MTNLYTPLYAYSREISICSEKEPATISVDHLIDEEVSNADSEYSDGAHHSEACIMWWPLNHSEIFAYSNNAFVEDSIILSCPYLPAWPSIGFPYFI